MHYESSLSRDAHEHAMRTHVLAADPEKIKDDPHLHKAALAVILRDHAAHLRHEIKNDPTESALNEERKEMLLIVENMLRDIDLMSETTVTSEAPAETAPSIKQETATIHEFPKAA